jgi:hypothetical protein
MKISVILDASSEEASFDIELNQNPFVDKWIKELKWCLNNCQLNQDEAFASFRSLEESALILIQSCVTINKYLKNFIILSNNILEESQDYFNYLHKKFEQLNGSWEHPTRLFQLANNELRSAIRNLNFYIHRVETKQQLAPELYISFNKDQYRRIPMMKQDYEYSEFSFPAGTLFVHYVELGKNYRDLYKDGLTIDYKGHKNLHYYSGEASIMFRPYFEFKNKDYLNWLTNQGIDPYNKSLGHGKIPLGQITDLSNALEKLSKYQSIKQLILN